MKQTRKATARIETKGDHAILSAERMVLTIKQGQIVQIVNTETGREYMPSSSGVASPDLSTGLVYVESGVSEHGEKASVIGATFTEGGAAVLVPKLISMERLPVITQRQLGEGCVEYAFRSENDDYHMTIQYSVDEETGGILIRQSGSGNRNGLSALRFGLGPISCRGGLLIPAFNGIVASRGDRFYEYETSAWEWPSGWQLQWIAFDDGEEGLWIHAQDVEGRFKQVAYHYEGDDRWRVALDVKSFASFEAHRSIEPFTWRLNTYEGDWSAPAGVYKRWAHKTYDMAGKAKLRPQWIHDIRLVVREADHISADLIAPYLDVLAEQVDPSATLLWLNHWMTTEQNRHDIMPNYEKLGNHGVAFYREARKRGFRLMPYTNYTAITPTHPRFEEFKPYCIRNPYSNAYEGWNLHGEFDNWEEVRGIKLYYVNPAHRPWRDYVIGQIGKLFAEHPMDALYIDQTFLIFNDGNGPIGGRSVLDGNLAFHKELCEALPGVPITGESINEITMQYESFASPWFLGVEVENDIEGKALGWKQNPNAFPRMVPLIPRFLEPYTRLLGPWDVSRAAAQSSTSSPQGIDIYNPIPSLERPTIEQLEDPDSLVRRTIQRAMK